MTTKSFHIRGFTQEEQNRYSELKVLRSGAGYYIGTIYRNPEGFEEPGSRDTHYFRTEEEAQTYLDMLNFMNDDTAMKYMRLYP
jgi:hypothetical protein